VVVEPEVFSNETVIEMRSARVTAWGRTRTVPVRVGRLLELDGQVSYRLVFVLPLTFRPLEKAELHRFWGATSASRRRFIDLVIKDMAEKTLPLWIERGTRSTYAHADFKKQWLS
jgi:hypothetical protein